MDIGHVLTLLTSRAKLDRDKAYKALETALPSFSESDIRQTCEFVLSNIVGTQGWEFKHGSLTVARLVISSWYDKLPEGFCSVVEDSCFALMADKEFRVRYLAAEVIGSLAKQLGPSLYERRRNDVLGKIRELLSREAIENDTNEANNQRQRRCSSPSPTRDYSDSCDGESFTGRPSSPSNDCGSDTMRRVAHELDDWKALEVWVKCLLCIVEGIGEKFRPYIDEYFLDLLFDTLNHKDRYVREIGYQIVAELVADDPAATNENSALRQKIASLLRTGLSDNWSNVRMAACVASRKFFESISEESLRNGYYGILVPPLCLNRYHLAEGVRLYSQDTWKIVTKGEGKCLVEQHLPSVVDFYVEQCDAKNHAVREAACACISELAVKMNKELVCSHVPRLMDTLLLCFSDDSWPVRDGACQACSKFIATFPEECRSNAGKIVALMAENLRDSIPSVRAGAAHALGVVAKTYKGEIHSEIVEKYVFAGLHAVMDQPDEAHRFSNGNEFHLVKNDQMGDAVNTHLRRFCRPAEPWEFTDGAICLFVEVSNTLSPAEVAKAVELTVNATNRRNYSQHSALLATLCKQLPELAKKLGKQAFKAHLESFFDPLFYCIDQQHLALVAGENCVLELCRFIGPSVFRGRVQNYNPVYLKLLDRLIPPLL